MATEKVTQQVMIDRTLNYIDSLVFRARVKFNGVYRDYEINKTIKRDNKVRKYIYMTDEPGLVEEVQLIASDGAILALKKAPLQKTTDGQVLAFEFGLEILEGNEEGWNA